MVHNVKELAANVSAVSAQIKERDVIISREREIDSMVIRGVDMPRTIAVFDTPSLDCDRRHEIGLANHDRVVLR